MGLALSHLCELLSHPDLDLASNPVILVLHRSLNLRYNMDNLEPVLHLLLYLPVLPLLRSTRQWRGLVIQWRGSRRTQMAPVRVRR